MSQTTHDPKVGKVELAHHDVVHQPQRNRRIWLFQGIAMLATILLYVSWQPFSTLCGHTSKQQLPFEIVDEVLNEVPLIDGHNDFPFATRFIYHNHLYDGNITHDANLTGQVDFPRLRKGRAGGTLWSVWVPCPGAFDSEVSSIANETEFPDEDYYEAIHDTFQQIDLVKRMIAEFPQDLVAASTAADVWSNHAESKVRISSLMGVEGLHAIGNAPSFLRMYHALGVRYATLTHFCHNKYADSASQPPRWHGLSKEGKAIITEMNRIGMMVDLAHTSADTMRQTLDYTDVPLIFSHSSSYTVCPHPRNVPDDVLWKVKDNNGVVMITFLNDYVNCKEPANATVSDVADHVQHVGNLIGYEHLGIGSDYDGMETAPIGLEDVSKYPALLEELASRGVTKQQLKGIAGANVLRVLRDVELAAQRLGKLKPLEDEVKRIKVPGQAQMKYDRVE